MRWLLIRVTDLYYFGINTYFADECPIPSLMSIIDPAQRRVKVSSVALGDEHGLLVDVAGRVFSFGNGTYGQHGLGHEHAVGHATLLDSLAEKGGCGCSFRRCRHEPLSLSELGWRGV